MTGKNKFFAEKLARHEAEKLHALYLETKRPWDEIYSEFEKKNGLDEEGIKTENRSWTESKTKSDVVDMQKQ